MDTTGSQEHPGEAEAANHGNAGLRASIEELKERIQSINQQAKGFIKEHPGACLMAALGLGYLLARAARRRS